MNIFDAYRDKTMPPLEVIRLRTIPRCRELNKIDMDIVDKLTSTFVSVYEASKESEYYLGSINIIVKFGVSYVVPIAVSEGRIVNGVECPTLRRNYNSWHLRSRSCRSLETR